MFSSDLDLVGISSEEMKLSSHLSVKIRSLNNCLALIFRCQGIVVMHVTTLLDIWGCSLALVIKLLFPPNSIRPLFPP